MKRVVPIKAMVVSVIIRDFIHLTKHILNDTAVLSDFGVARHIYMSRHYDKTKYVAGTLYFMGTEQALGEGEDGRTDIYSMRAAFFNMPTGENPFPGEMPEEIVQQQLHVFVQKLPQLHRHLQSFRDRMMSKRKNSRYSAAALLDHLGGLKAMP